MSQLATDTGYVVRHVDDVEPTPCPCGSATRIIKADDCKDVGFHITHIQDSRTHYHKKTTEIYHILEGHGTLEIGSDKVELRPGLTILIKPGTPHRGYGDFKTIVVPQPAFDPSDEFFPDEE